MRFILALVIFLGLFAGPECGAALRGDQAPIVFKTLLIIKRHSQIEQAPFLPVRAELTENDIQVVKDAFEKHTAYWVETLTKGRVKWEGTAIVSELPLRTVNGDKTCAACGPSNYPSEVDRLAPIGKYDGIFVYFKHIDDRTGYTLPRAFGLSVGPNPDANYAGQTCINWAPVSLWTRDSETAEIFLHEWLHHLEAFYGSKGVRLPRGGLHGNVEHGYKYNGGWKDWYRDFLNGTIAEGDEKVGLGERAWSLGTIREAVPKGAARAKKSPPTKPGRVTDATERYLKPDFVENNKALTNLLVNGGFEDERDLPWELTTFRSDNLEPASIDRTVFRTGAASRRLAAEQQDDIRSRQTIRVEPFSNYLFSGWVRTENVRVEEAGGVVGANLAVSSGEHSVSLDGTHDWTYVVVMFYSADRTQVEVIARLGGHGSTSTGVAWFDDLKVVKVRGVR